VAYIPDSFKCDVCTKIKGETNHWILAITDAVKRTISLSGFSVKLARRGKHTILCGEECLHKYISENTDKLRG
jgi:hypothetical protein